jgi:hypothetical protein
MASRTHAIVRNHMPTSRAHLPNPRPSLQISKTCFGGDLDYLMGEFNGGCTAADGCREQALWW